MGPKRRDQRAVQAAGIGVVALVVEQKADGSPAPGRVQGQVDGQAGAGHASAADIVPTFGQGEMAGVEGDLVRVVAEAAVPAAHVVVILEEIAAAECGQAGTGGQGGGRRDRQCGRKQNAGGGGQAQTGRTEHDTDLLSGWGSREI
jgi:hypothetical protein